MAPSETAEIIQLHFLLVHKQFYETYCVYTQVYQIKMGDDPMSRLFVVEQSDTDAWLARTSKYCFMFSSEDERHVVNLW